MERDPAACGGNDLRDATAHLAGSDDEDVFEPHPGESNVLGVTELWFDESASGDPVVLLHEGVVDSRNWDRVVPILRDRFRVIRYDQRGYGRSPMWNGPYSVVEDLVSVLDAAGAGRAALIGASRGGKIALATTVAHPERVSALVLVASASPEGGLNIEVTPEQERRWEEAETSGDHEAMAEIDMEIWAPMGADEELRTQFVENAVASNGDDPGEGDDAAAGRLGEISVPTLVITAGRDIPAMAEVGDRMAAKIPGAQRAVIEESDHMVPWRAPEELSHLILDFLS